MVIDRRMATIIIVVGIILALVSVLADSIGIGGSDDFGYLQLIGLVVGIILVLAGAYLGFIRHRAPVA